jgi:hypothetical protein
VTVEVKEMKAADKREEETVRVEVARKKALSD